MNHIGSNEALILAHNLEHWHDYMEEHRDSLMRLGFRPDGHSEWEGCPHAQARTLWQRALQVIGSAAYDLKYLHARVFEESP